MFFLKATENDIKQIQDIHKEKDYHKMNDIIVMTFRLSRDESYKLITELAFDKRLENDIYYMSHMGKDVMYYQEGTEKGIKYGLYVVQEIEHIYSSRKHISKKETQKYHLVVKRKENINYGDKFLISNKFSDIIIMSANSLDELRKKYKEKFRK